MGILQNILKKNPSKCLKKIAKKFFCVLREWVNLDFNGGFEKILMILMIFFYLSTFTELYTLPPPTRNPRPTTVNQSRHFWNLHPIQPNLAGKAPGKKQKNAPSPLVFFYKGLSGLEGE